MRSPQRHTAEAARQRLLHDRAQRPIDEQRARLAMLGEKLDRLARTAITQELAVRVRSDRRLAPALGQLFRIALR